ncbi:MAG: hypothetical protein M3Z23_03475 [Acidobacteriota bacterium]|nr:hypothetical protein [Acidobacteriota bacterium]
MNAPPSAGFGKDLPVVITGLGAVAITITGLIVEISGTSMTLQAARELSRGRLVRIEARDTLWLGEVSECVQEERFYRLDVKLAHALYGLEELVQLAARFVGNPKHAGRQEAPEITPVLAN